MLLRVPLTLWLLTLSLLACSDPRGETEKEAAISETKATVQLQFLTRDGCANTPKMRQHLAAASDSILGTKLVITELNQADLDSGDPRRGYPTPTVLLNGKDLFGLPEPTPPYPHPT